MISELFDDLFSPYSSMSDRILSGLLLFLLAVLFVLIALLAYLLIDNVNITASRSMVTVIEEKHVVPAHSTTMLIPMGKVLVPMISYEPTTYHLEYQIEGQDQDSSVEKSFYDQARVGNHIKVEYGRGRLSGSPVPAGFELVE